MLENVEVILKKKVNVTLKVILLLQWGWKQKQMIIQVNYNKILN